MPGIRLRRAGIVLVALLVLIALVTDSSAAGKKKKKKPKRVERVAEATYQTPAFGGAGGMSTACEVAEGIGCVSFDVEEIERYVSLTIEDVTGEAVYASVYVFGYTDGGDTHAHICGVSSGSLALVAGLERLVLVIEEDGGVAAGCPGPAAQGTVTATFSNLP